MVHKDIGGFCECRFWCEKRWGQGVAFHGTKREVRQFLQLVGEGECMQSDFRATDNGEKDQLTTMLNLNVSERCNGRNKKGERKKAQKKKNEEKKRRKKLPNKLPN
jgi:hypothetical protein